MKLSIIVPCYNEEKYIAEIVQRVKAVELKNVEKEILVTDDGSSDRSYEIAKAIDGIKCFLHPQNQGKGMAIKTALAASTGDVVLIQDADLEYDPCDYEKLLAPIIANQADVVYGSRLGDTSSSHFHFFGHYLANLFLTFLSNQLNRPVKLSDMETGYKVFTRSAIFSINLEERGFGFEPEVTIKLLRGGWRFAEVDISYVGRSYAEGKKIKFKDALRTIFCLFKYTFKKYGKG